MISRLHNEFDPGDDDVDWEAEYEKMRLAGLRENINFYINNKKKLKPIPLEWTAQDKCPACFGNDMCEAIENGEILIEIPTTDTPASKKGVYLGEWKDIPIAVKRLSNWYPKEFESFDKFICKDATGSEKCNIAEVIVGNNSFAQQKAAYLPEKMHQLWKISYQDSGPLSLAYVLRSTILISFKFCFLLLK